MNKTVETPQLIRLLGTLYAFQRTALEKDGSVAAIWYKRYAKEEGAIESEPPEWVFFVKQRKGSRFEYQNDSTMFLDQFNDECPPLQLVGSDGNAFSILARARKAARRAGWTPAEVKAYTEEAKSGDYHNLLRVTMERFAVD